MDAESYRTRMRGIILILLLCFLAILKVTKEKREDCSEWTYIEITGSTEVKTDTLTVYFEGNGECSDTLTLTGEEMNEFFKPKFYRIKIGK